MIRQKKHSTPTGLLRPGTRNLPVPKEQCHFMRPPPPYCFMQPNKKRYGGTYHDNYQLARFLLLVHPG